MVSFDVTSLFTQVPIDEALKVVKARRTKDPTLVDRTSIPVPQLVELIELCLRSTYFQFQNNFFEQIDGTCTHGLSPIPRHRQPLHGRSGRTSHAHLNQMSVYQHPIHNRERRRGEACIPGCPDDTQQRPTVHYSVQETDPHGPVHPIPFSPPSQNADWSDARYAGQSPSYLRQHQQASRDGAPCQSV